MLEKIRKPIDKEMVEFNKLLNKTLQNDNPAVSSLVGYVFEKKGKQMRPLLVLLTAALHGEINNRTYLGAILAELTHAASLIHDDIVDEAFVRRGKLSANALWRSKVAVLTGDYILAKAMTVAVKNEAADLLYIIIDSFEKLSEGELIQLQHAAKLDTDNESYFETINKKTASLLGSCAALGARSVHAPEEFIERMRLFGEYIGMAFQIGDDILDFKTEGNTGKPALKDIKDRKITLPLLQVLNNSEDKRKKEILNLLSSVRYNEENAEKIHRIIRESGGVELSIRIMNDFIGKALSILDIYEDSPVKESLQLYTNYIVERDR